MWIVELIVNDGEVIWRGTYTDERCARSAYERAMEHTEMMIEPVLVCIRPV